MRYTIDLQNGITVDFEGSLRKAMESADGKAKYTQKDIVILDEFGAEVARRRWYSGPYDPDKMEPTEEEVIQFGELGYYDVWN